MLQKQKGSVLMILLFIFLIIFLIGGVLFINKKNQTLKKNLPVKPTVKTTLPSTTTNGSLDQQLNDLDSQLNDVNSSLNDKAIDVNQE
jgi:uncharacterized protein YneF (UPF0154 family)